MFLEVYFFTSFSKDLAMDLAIEDTLGLFTLGILPIFLAIINFLFQLRLAQYVPGLHRP
tara:strand:+ start:420 stop:596 length:177 start_codon:yes stop_codon:yes gene_type:complete